MNNNLTEIIFVLDRSGSMEHLTTETIGGFTSLIEKQKADNNGEVRVTTVLFDNEYELLHDHVEISNVPLLTRKEYYARGCTALLDAVGRTIDTIGKRLSNTPENERPGHILFVITTDGYENASSDYSKSKIKKMIQLQSETYNWQFLFLGANIDAVGEADSIGIKSTMACSPSASPKGVSSTFNAVGNIVKFMRSSKSCEAKEVELACEEALSSIE